MGPKRFLAGPNRRYHEGLGQVSPWLRVSGCDSSWKLGPQTNTSHPLCPWVRELLSVDRAVKVLLVPCWGIANVVGCLSGEPCFLVLPEHGSRGDFIWTHSNPPCLDLFNCAVQIPGGPHHHSTHCARARGLPSPLAGHPEPLRTDRSGGRAQRRST